MKTKDYNKEIEEKLIKLSEEKYKSFSQNLIPGINNILGVRIPRIREIAKEISKNDYRLYLENAKDDYFEETMLQGIVIGSLKKSNIEEVLKYTENFIGKINNWSVCDTFCSGLKITKNHQEEVLKLIEKYLDSDKEYEVRFAVVMLMNYYTDDKHINLVLEKLNNIKLDKYYVQMAIAWAVSMCYIKYEDITMEFIKNNNLDNFTYNKSLQKICESTRISKDKKEIIKSLKRK